MTKNQAEFLSGYGGEMRGNYSGRGMFGKSTSAIVFESPDDFYNTLAEAISDCVGDADMEGGDLLCDMLRKLQTDSMGLSIIYY